MIEFFSKFRKQLLAIFDVEGVLYDGEYLPILAEKLNKEKEIWDITKKGIQGLINWEDGLKKRVDALKGLSIDEMNPYINIPIATNMGITRNALLAYSCEASVAVSGQYGTLSEIAYALQLDKPVVGLET